MIKNLVVEEDNKNNIAMIDSLHVEQYSDNLAHQSEIEGDQYNASAEV